MTDEDRAARSAGTAPAASRPGDPHASMLGGARVLVTRGGAAGERDAAEVRARGGLPVQAPLTEIAPPSDPAPLEAAAAAWNRGEYEWLLVTSANAADAFAAAGAAAPEASRPGDPRVAAVGPATADALRARGFDPALAPSSDYSAVGLVEALLELPTDAALRFLLPVSELADRTLETALERAGHRVDRVTAYRTLPAPRDTSVEASVRAGEVDVILVLSASGAREVARRFAPLPPGVRLAAIGAPSGRALAEHGLAADVIADPHTVSNLLDRVSHALFPSTPGGRPA
ncbi:uroporphyrinogen-III synthase [Leucobacter sp. USCH14]|uniref:uroporphyrinogen-III synthase n=1 Tax=Leucobacter sp. USCH14 TaxID=3024838 RepID=UPI003097997C